MAYYSLNAYDADVRIQQFAGLNQYGNGINGDVRFSPDAINMDTFGGALQPPADYPYFYGSDIGNIGTLASFFQQDYNNYGIRKEFLVAACGGKLWCIPVKQGQSTSWKQIIMPDGVTSFQSDEWSWARYEYTNPNTSNPSSPYPESVLLMSNEKDGLILIHSNVDDNTNSPIDIISQYDSGSGQYTPPRFGVIEVHAERVWGSSVVARRDTLWYSEAFNPYGWEPSTDIYDTDGAGEIRQPTWDGDKIMAMKSFGGQLIVMMQRRIFRIMGMSPGEFSAREMYGAGTFNHRTVAVYGERMYFAGEDGVTVFDGQTASGYLRQATDTIWKSLTTVNKNLMNATVYDGKYILAIPDWEDHPAPIPEPWGHTTLLIYNLTEGTVLAHKYDYAIREMTATYARGVKFIVWYVGTGGSGRVRDFEFNGWDTGTAMPVDSHWVTPWMDFANRLLRKGPMDVYFTPEVQDYPVELKFTIQTDTEEKTKSYTIQPLTAREEQRNGTFKRVKLRFHVKGRRFRLRIDRVCPPTVISGDANPLAYAPWRLVGGIQMKVETEMTE